MSIQSRFEQFLQDVTLGDRQIKRMESARATLASYLCNSYGLKSSDVFLQGSYANGTAIRPLEGGEYDLDIVCARPFDGTADEALSDLESVLKDNGNYAPRIRRKKPCVRLEFAEDDAGKFHVDVVPARYTLGKTPSLSAPRRGDGWHDTAPAEYTAWCAAQGIQYTRTVKMLKHWRNQQQPVRKAIKSIVLQVIAQSVVTQNPDDATRLADAFGSLADWLGPMTAVPVILNPVLPSENLSARWSWDDFVNFRSEVVEAKELSSLAIATTDEGEASDLWSMLFGEAFPTETKDSFGLQLGDYSHAKPESAQGWIQNIDTSYSISFKADVRRGKKSVISKMYRDDGPPIYAGKQIRFHASTTGPLGYEIWWQVANTGGHARSISGGLRGDYFRGKNAGGGTSPDQSINWELTSYTGTHLIRPLLVVQDVVVAKAPWMRINIVDPSRRFAL